MRLKTALLALGWALSAQAQTYDLLLKGGHVIDPKNGIDRVMDVAIAGGKSPESPRASIPARRRRPWTSPDCT